MNCLTQKRTDCIHTQPVNPIRLEQLKQDWRNHLRNNIESISNQYRLGLTEMIHLKSIQEDRTLFHLTLTYKPYQDRIYQESDVNKFFIKFYTQYLLPHLLGTRRIQNKRELQPICLAFIDEHEMKPVKVSRLIDTGELRDCHEFPARLHHHAILAVHPSNVEVMQNLVGTNTLNSGEFSHKVMTSDLKECDAKRLLYASKMMKRYPDFLSFPDRMKSSH